MIDGSHRGNSARFLNHACMPNWEAIEVADRVFIHARVAIAAGEDLFIDYGFAVHGEVTEVVRAQYSCRYCAAACRQSMLSAEI